MSADKRVYFKHGCADGPGRAGVGTGSRVFELNIHLRQFGRPQARTITIWERQERIARAKAAANAKREATRLSQKRARLQHVADAAAAAGDDAAAAGGAAGGRRLAGDTPPFSRPLSPLPPAHISRLSAPGSYRRGAAGGDAACGGHGWQ